MNVTPTDVDNNYDNFKAAATNGIFNTVCHMYSEGLAWFLSSQPTICNVQAGGIMLTHEINNYTMSEAIKEYPSLKTAFKVLYNLINL